jgi:hypothetical protein
MRAQLQWLNKPWLIAQSVMAMAMAGIKGLPMIPLVLENTAHVLLASVSVGLR